MLRKPAKDDQDPHPSPRPSRGRGFFAFPRRPSALAVLVEELFAGLSVRRTELRIQRFARLPVGAPRSGRRRACLPDRRRPLGRLGVPDNRDDCEERRYEARTGSMTSPGIPVTVLDTGAVTLERGRPRDVSGPVWAQSAPGKPIGRLSAGQGFSCLLLRHLEDGLTCGNAVSEICSAAYRPRSASR